MTWWPEITEQIILTGKVSKNRKKLHSSDKSHGEIVWYNLIIGISVLNIYIKVK